MSTETIVARIAAETGKEKNEIKQLVEQKKEKFAGLLTEEGAAFMIAREMNVDLEEGELGQKFLGKTEKATVAGLREGMQGIDLELKVMHVFAPKEFEKQGKKGKLCSMIVGDATGETRLTVWNESIGKLDAVERADIIIAKNCFVKTFQEKPQLSLSYNGEIVLKKKGKDEKIVQIKDLTENMNDVSIRGKITANNGTRNFQKENNEGKITSLELEDDTGKTRIAAWNETAEEAAKLKQGEQVKIEGAYTKQGQNGAEIHLGWRARIIRL